MACAGSVRSPSCVGVKVLQRAYALEETGLDQADVVHRPRLLSDNGPCYISGQLAEYLEDKGMKHTRGTPYHPQTQGSD